jgi:tRNA 2-thiouridine synthesizing protein A
MVEVTLNLSGLECPLPVLRTRAALKKMSAGQRLTVICTDPLTEIDIPHLLHSTGDSLETKRRDEDAIVFVILKS